MKKKLSILLLIVFAIPLFAMFGCGEKGSFYVDVISSWTGISSGSLGGTVSGAGTYKEGSSVTLTATAKPKSRFIAWVFEDNVLISQNSTYSIKNETTDNYVVKSQLTFSSNKNTKGRYTAIFEDSKILYTKLTSWQICDHLPTDENPDNQPSDAPVYASIYVTQMNLGLDVYSALNFETSLNTRNETNTVNQILKLNAEKPQEISIDLTLNENATTFSKLFKAEIPFAESVDKFDDLKNPYQVNFTEYGVYQIIFKFNLLNQERFLIVEYSNLNVIM